MQRNARKAFIALKKAGFPVFEVADHASAHFGISGEESAADGLPTADYYQEFLKERIDEQGKVINAFGIRQAVLDVLKENELFAEWLDPGTLLVFDS